MAKKVKLPNNFKNRASILIGRGFKRVDAQGNVIAISSGFGYQRLLRISARGSLTLAWQG